MNSNVARAFGSDRTAHDAVRCTASDVLRWAGMASRADAQTNDIRFPLRFVRAAQVLVHEGQPFDTLHVVSAGSFKSVQTDAEGYEQVLGFAIHGDFIGLDGLGQPTHATGTVALEDSCVVSLNFLELLTWGRRVPAMESLLHHAAGLEMLRRSDTQYLMSAPSSEVRLVRFLLQTSRRQAVQGWSEHLLRLRMTRRDIGSYLGLAHETVSRALTALAQEGHIRVHTHDIELTNLPALHEFQRLTRRRPREEATDANVHPLPLRHAASTPSSTWCA